MTRGAFAATALTVTAILAACSDASSGSPSSEPPPNVTCVRDRDLGSCDCSEGSNTIRVGDVVSDCNHPAAGATCCYDINGAGTSTSCACLVPACVQDSDTEICVCKYYEEFQVGNVRDTEHFVDVCMSGVCCQTDFDCGCAPNGMANGCAGTVVPSCSKPTSFDCGGTSRSATSCAGIRWR